jgi:hypothetical protein
VVESKTPFRLTRQFTRGEPVKPTGRRRALMFGRIGANGADQQSRGYPLECTRAARNKADEIEQIVVRRTRIRFIAK